MRSATILPFPANLAKVKPFTPWRGPAQVIPFPRVHIGDLIARADKALADWRAVRDQAQQARRDILTLEQ